MQIKSTFNLNKFDKTHLLTTLTKVMDTVDE